MTNRNAKLKPAEQAREEAERKASYRRRIAAAGLDNDEVPQDMDEFRLRLARRIAIFNNEWRGCQQSLCKRHGGCMAPDIVCSNVPDEPCSPEEWERVRAEVRRELDRLIAERGLDGA